MNLAEAVAARYRVELAHAAARTASLIEEIAQLELAVAQQEQMIKELQPQDPWGDDLTQGAASDVTSDLFDHVGPGVRSTPQTADQQKP